MSDVVASFNSFDANNPAEWYIVDVTVRVCQLWTDNEYRHARELFYVLDNALDAVQRQASRQLRSA